MPHLLRNTMIACSLLLGGCASGPLTQEQINVLVTQIQTYTAQACAAQPTVAGAISLIGSFYTPAAPFITLANAIGDAFCRAPVTAASVRRGVVSQTRIVATPKGPVAVQAVSYGPAK